MRFVLYINHDTGIAISVFIRTTTFQFVQYSEEALWILPEISLWRAGTHASRALMMANEIFDEL